MIRILLILLTPKIAKLANFVLPKRLSDMQQHIPPTTKRKDSLSRFFELRAKRIGFIAVMPKITIYTGNKQTKIPFQSFVLSVKAVTILMEEIEMRSMQKIKAIPLLLQRVSPSFPYQSERKQMLQRMWFIRKTPAPTAKRSSPPCYKTRSPIVPNISPTTIKIVEPFFLSPKSNTIMITNGNTLKYENHLISNDGPMMQTNPNKKKQTCAKYVNLGLRQDLFMLVYY